jgi:predicted acylesterase/phospholipase RssA
MEAPPPPPPTPETIKIRHLVISGGAVNGLFMYGSLQQAQLNGIWNSADLTSIHATSVGTMLALIILLRFDWETMDKYLIERPWEKVFAINSQLLFESYVKKGLFDTALITEIFKPLFMAKDMNVDITFAELYAKTNIDFHCYSFDLNNFCITDISHSTFPDLPVLTGITMSSALPGLFAPVFLTEQEMERTSPNIINKNKNGCFIDGGVRANYPVQQCMDAYPETKNNPQSILGITLRQAEPNKNENNENNENKISYITPDSNILEYFVEFANKINHCLSQQHEITNLLGIQEIECPSCADIFDLKVCQEVISSPEMRCDWINRGKQMLV